MTQQKKILLFIVIFATLILVGFMLLRLFFLQEEGTGSEVRASDVSGEFVLPTEICDVRGADCYVASDERSSLDASTIVRFESGRAEQYLLLASKLYDENIRSDAFSNASGTIVPLAKAIAIEIFSYTREGGITLLESLALPEIHRGHGMGITFESPTDLNSDGYNEVVYTVWLADGVAGQEVSHGLLTMNADKAFHILPVPSAQGVAFLVNGEEEIFTKDTGEVGFVSKFFYDESKTQEYLTISALLRDEHSERFTLGSQTLGTVYYKLDEDYEFQRVYHSICDLTSMSEYDCGISDKEALPFL